MAEREAGTAQHAEATDEQVEQSMARLTPSTLPSPSNARRPPDLPPRTRSSSNATSAEANRSSSATDVSYGNLAYAPRQSSYRGSNTASRLTQQINPASGATTPPATQAPSPASNGRQVQRQGLFKATQTAFASHSTLFAAQQSSPSPAESVTQSVEAEASDRSKTPEAGRNDSIIRQSQHVEDALRKCESIGLARSSPGAALVKRLCEAVGGEWSHLADLVSQGEAVLLLPVSSKSSSQVAQGTLSGSVDSQDAFPPPSLAFAYDHVLVGPSGRPSSASSEPDTLSARGCATLSGLRGIIHQDDPSLAAEGPPKMIFKSFVNRKDHSWPSELREKGSRRRLFSTLPPLPQASCADFPFPNYTIMDSVQLDLPVMPSSATDMGGNASRPAPSTFATLFGGAGRDRRRDAPQGSADGDKEVLAAASVPNDADIQDFSTATHRTIHAMLIDRPLRRSRALRGMTYSIKARLSAELERRANIDAQIAELVGSFASTFYPQVESSSANSVRRQRSHGTLLAGAVTQSQPAPHEAHPDEVQALFQQLYAKVAERLEKADSSGGPSPAPEMVWQQLEVVEELLIKELYDRLFSPSQSSDPASDISLASRIAALNVLGLDWDGLGLRLPQDGGETKKALDNLMERCGRELETLQTDDCHTPKRKLDVLVGVHRIIVEELGKMNSIQLKDSNSDIDKVSAERQRDPSSSTVEGQQESSERPRQTNTSSADLILPVLIRLITRSNPPALASHLVFIQRFRSEQLLSREGEVAYCLINFQAAVKFIEEAKPADLGLEAGQGMVFDSNTERVSDSEDPSPAKKSAAMEILKSVSQGQQSQHANTVQPGDMMASAGVAGRVKGLSNVVNSSFSVLGKVIGSGASAGMEAWDRSSKNIDGVKTLDDIRKLLSAGPRNSNIGGGGGGLTGATVPSGGTDYSRPDEQRHDRPLPIDGSGATPGASSLTNKPSLSDRLANLNRKLMTPSPTIGAEEQLLPSGETLSPEINFKALQSTPSRPTLKSRLTAGTIGSNHTAPAPGAGAPSALGLLSGAEVEQEEDRPLPASLQSPYAPLSRPPSRDRPLHVVIASSGSVASVKVPLMVERLLSYANVRVQVIATKPSLHFYEAEEIQALAGDASAKGSTTVGRYTVAELADENLRASRSSSGIDDSGIATAAGDSREPSPRAHLWTDEDEWRDWKKVGDPILHIELRRWADIVLVAPCSANTLAKIAGGLCDDLLTSFLRALSPDTPTLIFPAMNTLMYRHPLTASHLSIVTGLLGYEVHGPIEKRLACGDMGAGAMLEWTDIIGLVRQRFGLEEEAQPHVPNTPRITAESASRLETAGPS